MGFRIFAGSKKRHPPEPMIEIAMEGQGEERTPQKVEFWNRALERIRSGEILQKAEVRQIDNTTKESSLTLG